MKSKQNTDSVIIEHSNSWWNSLIFLSIWFALLIHRLWLLKVINVYGWKLVSSTNHIWLKAAMLLTLYFFFPFVQKSQAEINPIIGQWSSIDFPVKPHSWWAPNKQRKLPSIKKKPACTWSGSQLSSLFSYHVWISGGGTNWSKFTRFIIAITFY